MLSATTSSVEHSPSTHNDHVSPSMSPNTTPRKRRSRANHRMQLEDIPQAPVYYPTEEEFEDPYAYMNCIRNEAEKYGICKIVPPKTYQRTMLHAFETILQRMNFQFKTKVQNVHQLQRRNTERRGVNERFERNLCHFLKHVDNINHKDSEIFDVNDDVYIPDIKVPIFTPNAQGHKFSFHDEREIDFYQLFKTVWNMGGFERVTADKLWNEVAVGMCLLMPHQDKAHGNRSSPSPKKTKGRTQRSSLVKTLKKIYTDYLLSYEVFYRKALALIGEPQSPNNANKSRRASSSPVKRNRIAMYIDGLIVDAKHVSIDSKGNPVIMSSSSPKRVKANKYTDTAKVQDSETLRDDEKQFGYHYSDEPWTLKRFEQMANAFKENWFCSNDNKLASPPAIPPSDEEEGYGDDEEEEEAEEEAEDFFFVRPKHSLTNSNTTPPESPATVTSRHLSKLGLDDSPDKFNVPVSTIRKKARQGGVRRIQGYLYYKDVADVDETDIEQEYWNIIEQSDRKVQVYYGSDLGVTDHSSGFSEHHKLNWDLNVLPKLPESVLHHLKQDISGVSVPMLYIGMLFSTFSWHVEDNFLYSTNYIHHGASKTWYGVPSYAAEKFEAAMRTEVPSLFETRPDLLHHLVTMVSPVVLRRHDVPVYKCSHYPGEIMITFPRSYHAGFSNGFNFAESVNFAPGDWLPFGHAALQEYRQQRWRRSVLTYEKLLFDAASGDPSPEVSSHILNALETICNEERMLRKQTLSNNKHLSVLVQSTLKEPPPPQASQNEKGKTKKSVEKRVTRSQNRQLLIREEEQMPVCIVCKQDCFLSSACCTKCDKSTCLHHISQLCSCEKRLIQVKLRYSESEMLELVSTLREHIASL